MYRSVKKGISFLLVTLISSTLALSGCGNSKPSQFSSIGPTPSSIVVNPFVTDTEDNFIGKVGSEKISQSEFYYFFNQTKRNMEQTAQQQGSTDISKFWTTKIEGKDPKEVAKENSLTSLKDFKVQLLHAKEAKFTLTPQETIDSKKSLDDTFAKNGGEAAVADIFSKNYGISIDQYRAMYSNFNLVEKYMTQQQNQIPVSDEETSKSYTSNKANFDSVTVNHVLFMTLDQKTNQPLPQDKLDAAKKNADDTLAKINAGENITTLAQKLSEDPGVTENKGEYTFRKNGQMVKEFEDWAFSKKIGDTGIVKTNYGYHVIKKTKESTPEEGKKAAKTEIQKNKLIEQLKQWTADPKYSIEKNEKIINTLNLG